MAYSGILLYQHKLHDDLKMMSCDVVGPCVGAHNHNKIKQFMAIKYTRAVKQRVLY